MRHHNESPAEVLCFENRNVRKINNIKEKVQLQKEVGAEEGHELLFEVVSF